MVRSKLGVATNRLTYRRGVEWAMDARLWRAIVESESPINCRRYTAPQLLFGRTTVDSVACRPWGLICTWRGRTSRPFLYSVSGIAMACSFTVSNPERLSHWQRVAMVYLVLAAISAVTALGTLVALVQRARRLSRSNPPAV